MPYNQNCAMPCIVILFFILLSCGSKNGEEVYYYDNGNVKEKFIEQGEYLYFEAYYESGELKSKGYVNNNETREPQNEYVDYYKNGNIRIKANFKDGLRNGVMRRYHENGSIYQIIGYEAEIEKGIYELYDSNGLIQYKGTKDSLHRGTQYQYYENKNMKMVTEMTENDTIKFTLYNEDGTIQKIEDFRDE